MVEYSKNNRFPFLSKNTGTSVYMDNNENLYECDFIYEQVVDRFPELDAEEFYKKINGIQQNSRKAEQVEKLKSASDSLLRNIRTCLSDEAFVHQLHDRWGFGLDKLIGTLYAVYGYYFYTGKRTANIIKKIVEGYARKPVR